MGHRSLQHLHRRALPARMDRRKWALSSAVVTHNARCVRRILAAAGGSAALAAFGRQNELAMAVREGPLPRRLRPLPWPRLAPVHRPRASCLRAVVRTVRLSCIFQHTHHTRIFQPLFVKTLRHLWEELEGGRWSCIYCHLPLARMRWNEQRRHRHIGIDRLQPVRALLIRARSLSVRCTANTRPHTASLKNQ